MRLLLHAIGALAFTVPRSARASAAAARAPTRGRALVEQCAAADAPVRLLDRDRRPRTRTRRLRVVGLARAPERGGLGALQRSCARARAPACAALQLLERASRRASGRSARCGTDRSRRPTRSSRRRRALRRRTGLAEIDAAACARARARRRAAMPAGTAPPALGAGAARRRARADARLRARRRGAAQESLNAFDAMVSSRVCRARRPWSTRRPARALPPRASSGPARSDGEGAEAPLRSCLVSRQVSVLARARAALGSGARAAGATSGRRCAARRAAARALAAFLPLEDRCFGFRAPPAVAAAPGARRARNGREVFGLPVRERDADRRPARGLSDQLARAWAGCWTRARAREARTDYTVMRFVDWFAVRGEARRAAFSRARGDRARARLACSIDERRVEVDEVARRASTRHARDAARVPPQRAKRAARAPALDALRAHGVEAGRVARAPPPPRRRRARRPSGRAARPRRRARGRRPTPRPQQPRVLTTGGLKRTAVGITPSRGSQEAAPRRRPRRD